MNAESGVTATNAPRCRRGWFVLTAIPKRLGYVHGQSLGFFVFPAETCGSQSACATDTGSATIAASKPSIALIPT
jgi:hypothetical protein